jgi:flagellar protein FlbT
MPLRLSLKPNERVIIGGAVIRNSETRSEVLIENEVPILRETDILSPTNVNTACERIYLALQLMYVDPQRRDEHERTFAQLVQDVLAAAPSLAPQIEEIMELADAGRLYQALKSAQTLLQREKELINHVS